MPVLPDFGAARFEPGAPIDNPLFPLVPGTVYSYGGTDVDPETGESVVEHIDTFATFETKEIEGVTATVVRDTAYENDVLVEDTVDWYAQDTAGNVWYLGELTYAFEYDDAGNYVETSTEGSWEAGVDGAQPGYIMRAEPGFGASYYQEFAPGVAEDEAIVVGVDQEVSIGLGVFDGVLQTLIRRRSSPNRPSTSTTHLTSAWSSRNPSTRRVGSSSRSSFRACARSAMSISQRERTATASCSTT